MEDDDDNGDAQLGGGVQWDRYASITDMERRLSWM